MASVRQMPPLARGEEAASAITAITATGCEVAADSIVWNEGDFVRLVIDNRILINGTVLWRAGNRAGIRFFGELHRVIVDTLSSRPAGSVSASIRP